MKFKCGGSDLKEIYKSIADEIFRARNREKMVRKSQQISKFEKIEKIGKELTTKSPKLVAILNICTMFFPLSESL